MSDEPKIKNADRPSKTAGLPEMGDGASARGYLRDVDTKNSEADTPDPAEAPDPEGGEATHGAPTDRG